MSARNPRSATPRAPAAAATRFPQPYATVDLAAFSVIDDRLQVLLARRPDRADEPFPGRWCLPGGYVDVDRDADLVGCARRKLGEKTGLRDAHLEQLGSWGSASRDPRGWSATHVYLALTPPPVEPPAAAEGGAGTAWHDLDAARSRRLAFDHGAILEAAIDRLRSKAEYTSLPAFLLAEPFTLPQLQRAYEIVLGRPVDKSGFRTRMLAAGFLDETGPMPGDFQRSAMGYRLKDRTQTTLFPRTFSPRQ